MMGSIGAEQGFEARRGPRLWIGVVSVVALTAFAAGCGGGPAGEKVVAPLFDDVVRMAKGPPVSTTPRALPRPPAPSTEVRQLAVTPRQVRPAPALPPQLYQASPESELVATFIACDGIGFYFAYGRWPEGDDWLGLVGGAVLSRVPQYRARQVVDTLRQLASAPDPVVAASRATHELGCAFA